MTSKGHIEKQKHKREIRKKLYGYFKRQTDEIAHKMIEI